MAQGLIGELRDDVCLTIDAIKIEFRDMNTKLSVTYRAIANSHLIPVVQSMKESKCQNLKLTKGYRMPKSLRKSFFT